MKEKIPTYQLNNLSNESQGSPAIHFSDHKEKNTKLPLNVPYRSNYYGFSICVNGKAVLKTNLETYTIEQNCIITMSPQVVKQWVEISDNYETLTVFFTREFLINTNPLDNLPFFENVSQHVAQFSDDQCKSILALMTTIQAKYQAEHPYKNEILQHLISILLLEFAAIYDREILPSLHNQTRSQQIALEFKKLVCIHYAQERSVKFYANQIFVTAKHLTETIKAETGKSAGEWIDETIILEGKILLQNSALSINQVADTLHFADASTFGKFFKNLTSLSPLAYRKSI
jgi:AraC family transcriptional regulator, transcriptional activator of pobA